MKEVTIGNFGLLIAYLLPGFIMLWALGLVSDRVRFWLGQSADSAPSVGGFLYVTLASIGLGLTLSLLRWLILDKVHGLTGLRPPNWGFSKLQLNVEAFNVLVEVHYRYYQFYGNTLMALAVAYVILKVSANRPVVGWSDVGSLLVACLFFAGSRDTLRKYYSRVAQLLGTDDAPVAADAML